MIKLIHVRGAITPTSNFQATSLPKLNAALEESDLTDFTGIREIDNKGRISFDRSYTSLSSNPNLSELIVRLQKFLRSKDIKGLNFYGTLMVIMETTDDFPKLYKITVERGTVTYKEGSVTWNDKS